MPNSSSKCDLLDVLEASVTITSRAHTSADFVTVVTAVLSLWPPHNHHINDDDEGEWDPSVFLIVGLY